MTQRVGIGIGAIHNPPRAKYSQETRNLIKGTRYFYYTEQFMKQILLSNFCLLYQI